MAVQDDYEVLGALVEKARAKKNLSRETLAEQLGITDRHLFSIERENKTPSYQLLKQLVYALELSPDRIFYPGMSSHTSEQDSLIRAISRLDDREQAIIKDLVTSLSVHRSS